MVLVCCCSRDTAQRFCIDLSRARTTGEYIRTFGAVPNGGTNGRLGTKPPAFHVAPKGTSGQCTIRAGRRSTVAAHAAVLNKRHGGIYTFDHEGSPTPQPLRGANIGCVDVPPPCDGEREQVLAFWRFWKGGCAPRTPLPLSIAVGRGLGGGASQQHDLCGSQCGFGLVEQGAVRVQGRLASQVGVQDGAVLRDIALRHQIDQTGHRFALVHRIDNHALQRANQPDRVES